MILIWELLLMRKFEHLMKLCKMKRECMLQTFVRTFQLTFLVVIFFIYQLYILLK